MGQLALRLSILALLFAVNTVFAEAFEVDGICYDILSIEDKTVKVTYKNPYKYHGDVVIPESVYYNGELYSVTSIGSSAFGYCSGLTSVTIGNSVTSIGSSAFGNCSGLTSVTIGNSVTSIDDCAFYGCSGLTSLTIPNSVTSIGNYAFSGCSGLTSVTIGNSVTSIGNYAFSGCSGLTSVTIGNSVTSISRRAFSGCSGLTSLTIPNSVTSIDDCAFYGCSGLKHITLGNNVKYIGDNVFDYCYDLIDITSLNPTPPKVSIDKYHWLNFDATLKVPSGCWAKYKLAPFWEHFKTIIELETGIENVVDDRLHNCKNVYSIKGFKLPVDDLETLPKGIYIKNGKKLFIK